jgi:hypothetical protein
MLQVGASTRPETSMTDLIYLAAGIAVLALYALYAVALRRI